MGIAPPIQAANIGMADSLILMVLALVVFGPRRLPQIGRQVGKLMYEFRKASNDFKFQMEEELRKAEDDERRKREEAERQKALAAGQGAAPAVEERNPYAVEELSAKPPSTGEPVAAERPGRAASEAEAAAPATEPSAAALPQLGPRASEEMFPTKEPAAEVAPAATEPAAHNG